MTTRFRIVLSGAFALLALVGCLAYAREVRGEADRVRAEAIERFGGEVAPLVVAERQLEAGDVVGEQMVSVRDWAVDLAPAGALTGIDDVLGRTVSVPVPEGAPLTELNFREGSALAEVPAGHVAVSVPVTDRLGIAQGIARGARLCAYAVEADAPRLIATDVQVLSDLGPSGGVAAVQQVSLAVLPADVGEVLGASATGDLRLVMPAQDVALEGEPGEAQAPKELEPEEGEGHDD